MLGDEMVWWRAAGGRCIHASTTFARELMSSLYPGDAAKGLNWDSLAFSLVCAESKREDEEGPGPPICKTNCVCLSIAAGRLANVDPGKEHFPLSHCTPELAYHIECLRIAFTGPALNTFCTAHFSGPAGVLCFRARYCPFGPGEPHAQTTARNIHIINQQKTEQPPERQIKNNTSEKCQSIIILYYY